MEEGEGEGDVREAGRRGEAEWTQSEGGLDSCRSHRLPDQSVVGNGDGERAKEGGRKSGRRGRGNRRLNGD